MNLESTLIFVEYSVILWVTVIINTFKYGRNFPISKQFIPRLYLLKVDFNY